MTAVSFADRGRAPASDVLADAAAGLLPEWSVVSDARRGHILRVADLMVSWARRLGLGDDETHRWRAVAILHDALRDEDPDRLGESLPDPFRHWPPRLRHGPAVAARLEQSAVHDAELLDAICYHTTGHERFGRLGFALFAADWLEPGRTHDPAGRAALRARMPEALDDIVLEILRSRLARSVQRNDPIQPETLGFWHRMIGERRG